MSEQNTVSPESGEIVQSAGAPASSAVDPSVTGALPGVMARLGQGAEGGADIERILDIPVQLSDRTHPHDHQQCASAGTGFGG